MRYARYVYKTAITMLTIMAAMASIPVGKIVYAADFEGDGTAAEPYLIETVEQLALVGEYPYLSGDLHFKLTGNLDLSSFGDWTPIGNDSYRFLGHFDGGGFTISGLTIDRPGDSYVGLFGYTDAGSTIEGVKLADGELAGSQFVGGLVGYNYATVISNSSFSGNVQGDYHTGGLVGSSEDGIIEDGQTSGTVSGSYLVGGLVGYARGSGDLLVRASSTADVTGSGSNNEEIGGLAGGVSYGGIVDSSASGAVSGGNRGEKIGGLVGLADGISIRGSFASGRVSGRYELGGLAGSAVDGEISGSHATGDVTGTSQLGGLAGRNNGGSVEDSSASGNVTDTRGGDMIGGLIGENINGAVSRSSASGNASGDEESFFVGGLIGWNNGGETVASSASGNVRGMVDVGGLIGYNENAEIHDSHASGDVYGLNDSQQIGGLAGENRSLIAKSYALGDVSVSSETESYMIGGLVGHNCGEIRDSYAAGQVDGHYQTGGLIGYNNDVPVVASYASGDVTGIESVGGLSGYLVYQTIEDSYASGSVTGFGTGKNIGGLVGTNLMGTVTRSYASGSVTGLADVGGLVGLDWAGAVLNSFYDAETSGMNASGGGLGKTTAEMRSASTYEADAANSWNFSGPWAIEPSLNGGYPYLPGVQAFLDYNGNGATGGSVPDGGSYMPGTALLIDSGADPVSKTGHIFDGWNTAVDGSGTAYRDGDRYTVASSAALHASWIALSTDATLTSSIGTVSAGGTAEERIADVPYGTTLAELKAAITPAPNASFEIYEADGTTVADVLASGVKAIVTAEDGATTVVYTVTVLANDEKELLSFSFEELNPAVFGIISGTEVDVTVPNGTDVQALVATFAASADSTVSVEGMAQTSGSTANDFTTPVTYEVTAQDGSIATYIVTVVVKDLPSLSDLEVSSGGAALAADSVTGTVYRYVVPYAIGDFNVVASVDDISAVMSGSLFGNDDDLVLGPIALVSGSATTPLPLEVGNNRMEVVVTDDDGASRTYQIHVLRRHAGYDNAQLQSLQLTGGLLQYDRNELDYAVTVGNPVDTITVTAVPDEAGALVRINGELSESESLALQTGRNDVLIEVTAEDGTTTLSYRIEITREQPAPSSGSGGGGGVGGPVNSGSIDGVRGGSLTLLGATIEVKPESMDGMIKVTVDRFRGQAGLPGVPAKSLVGDMYEIRTDRTGPFNHPAVLTMPLDASKVDFAEFQVGLYGLDKRTGEWVLLGNQTTDKVNGSVAGTVPDFAAFDAFAVLMTDRDDDSQPEPPALSDIRGHWAEAAIREFVQLGALQGYPDHTFKPDRAITRGEFVSMIVKALGLDAGEGAVFADTAAHWARREIGIAASLGFATGYDDETFGPDDYITREQMAAIVVRAMSFKEASTTGVFTDQADISPWALSAISTAVANGLLTGYGDGTVKPAAHATRAEAVTLIVRALKRQAELD